MPNWKKVVTSGSNAELNNIDSSGYIDITGASSDPGVDGVVRLGQSSNALRIYTNSGYTQVGPANSGFSHFYTDRAKYYFNKNIVVDEGLVSSYNEDLILRRIYSSTANQITIGDDSYELTLDSTVRHSIDGVGNNTFTGNISASGFVSASSFAGDGAGLTNVSATATPAGSDTQVQFNDGGSLGASSILTFNGSKLSSTFLESTRASVMNESGHASGDFRVEGGGNTHLLFTDASEDAVGIKKSSPTAVLDITGDLRVSSHITASGVISASGGFVGDGSNLTGISTDIDGLDALGGTGVAQGDKFIFSDAGTEKSITFSNLEDAIFGNVSGEATIAAGGALTIAANSIGNNELKQDDDITLQSLTVTNDIDASGDGTFATITMTGKIDTSGEVEAETFTFN